MNETTNKIDKLAKQHKIIGTKTDCPFFNPTSNLCIRVKNGMMRCDEYLECEFKYIDVLKEENERLQAENERLNSLRLQLQSSELKQHLEKVNCERENFKLRKVFEEIREIAKEIDDVDKWIDLNLMPTQVCERIEKINNKISEVLK